jgi:hypothetical protein
LKEAHRGEEKMPIFTEVGPEARERLVSKSKGYQDRSAYREMLSQVGGGRMMEVRPDEGEGLRKLKVNVRRAANEMKLEDIQYGETEDGALLVWAEQRPRRARQPRGRKQAE